MDLLDAMNGVLAASMRAKGARSRRTDVEGHSLHFFEQRGPGRHGPMVLVHGLAGSAVGFYKVLRPLARVFSPVYAIDLPGCGLSSARGPVNGPMQYDALVAFLRQVVEQRAVVVGTSLGGLMSVQLGREHPELLRGLVLISPAGAKVPQGTWSAFIESLRVTDTEDALALCDRLFHRPPFGVRFAAQAVRRMYNAPSVQAILEQARQGELYVPPDQLGSLQVPILLVWGASERLLHPEGVSYFRAHLPAGTAVRVIDRAGHVPQVERPREVVKAVTAFAKSLAA